jgi:hypothetical protein
MSDVGSDMEGYMYADLQYFPGQMTFESQGWFSNATASFGTARRGP